MWINRNEYEALVNRIVRLEDKVMEIDRASAIYEGIYDSDRRKLKIHADYKYPLITIVNLILEHLKLSPRKITERIVLETKGSPEKGD
jgi:hypothetical protein